MTGGTAADGTPLAGLLVVDLTTFLSGPFATQLLGDLGADVIKVEPLSGDTTRSVPPYFVGPDSAYFLANNRNKRSIALDLKDAEARDAALALIARADVVIDNYRPGVLERLGFDVQALLEANPALVWASISGFGQHGPLRDQPAYDMIVQAQSGVMSLNGEPGRPSVRLGVPVGDTVAGLYAVIGILAARNSTSSNCSSRRIDISMLDAQLAMLSYQASYSIIGQMTPSPQGSRHDSIPTYRTFVCADQREIAVTANTERMWRSLCFCLGLEQLLLDDRFDDSALRLQNRNELWAVLEPAFLEHDAPPTVDRLNAHGVPASLIKNVPEALADARAAGRGMLVDLVHADGRRTEALGNPIHFPNVPPVKPVFPPSLGEHTRQVLTELAGLSLSSVDALLERGVAVSGEALSLPSAGGSLRGVMRA